MYINCVDIEASSGQVPDVNSNPDDGYLVRSYKRLPWCIPRNYRYRFFQNSLWLILPDDVKYLQLKSVWLFQRNFLNFFQHTFVCLIENTEHFAAKKNAHSQTDLRKRNALFLHFFPIKEQWLLYWQSTVTLTIPTFAHLCSYSQEPLHP